MDLIRHNMVVFSNGERALQVLPSLVDVIPEAKLNLVRLQMPLWHVLVFLLSLGYISSSTQCGTRGVRVVT